MKIAAKDIEAHIKDIVGLNGAGGDGFQLWFNQVRQEGVGTYREILSGLESIKPSGFYGRADDSILDLSFEVFYCSYQAARHHEEDMAWRLERYSDINVESLEEIEATSIALRQALTKAPSMIWWALFSPLNLNIDTETVNKFFGALETVSKYAHDRRSWPQDKDYYHYGLYYKNTGTKRTNRPSLTTALAFRLEFIFRCYTSGDTSPYDGSIGFYERAKMPSNGKPCRNLVAKLVNLTFPDAFVSGEDLKKLISHIVKSKRVEVGWGDWPLEPKSKEKFQPTSIGGKPIENLS